MWLRRLRRHRDIATLVQRTARCCIDRLQVLRIAVTELLQLGDDWACLTGFAEQAQRFGARLQKCEFRI